MLGPERRARAGVRDFSPLLSHPENGQERRDSRSQRTHLRQVERELLGLCGSDSSLWAFRSAWDRKEGQPDPRGK